MYFKIFHLVTLTFKQDATFIDMQETYTIFLLSNSK